MTAEELDKYLASKKKKFRHGRNATFDDVEPYTKFMWPPENYVIPENSEIEHQWYIKLNIQPNKACLVNNPGIVKWFGPDTLVTPEV